MSSPMALASFYIVPAKYSNKEQEFLMLKTKQNKKAVIGGMLMFIDILIFIIIILSMINTMACFINPSLNTNMSLVWG